MPSLRFTTKFLENVKTPTARIAYTDTACRGLELRVTPDGVKTWALRYRTPGGRAGRLRRITLGRLDDLDLKHARAKADDVRGQVATGTDPVAEKQAATVAATQGETIEALAQDYITKHAKVKKRTWADDQRFLDVEILPAWRARKVKELTRRDVRVVVERIAERGSPISANRCLAVIRKMLNFAVSQDWIDANPASLIVKPGVERSRERVLTDDEIRRVWAACDEERPAMAVLTKLRLLTAQRGGELSAIRWADIDGHWLTLPATLTKNKRAHRVFLTPTAKALIDALPHIEGVDYVFPGASGNRPCSDHKKAGQRIAARVLADLQQDDAKIEHFDFRGHDLRRTASTKMAEAGISQADIAKVLNHAEGGPKATHVYNRYQYDREKQIALETLDRVIAAILDANPRTSAKVIPMTKGA
jgi:integrase